MKKYILYLILFFISVPILIFFIDIPLADWVLKNISKNIIKISEFITEFGSFEYIVLTNILLILYFYITKNKRFSLMFYGIITQGVIVVIIRILKCFFGRARPYNIFENNLDKQFFFFQLNDNFLSFPSGHSAGIWAFIICMLFVFKDKKYIKLLIIFGILIPLTRLILQFHFLSDILTGTLIASIIEYYLMKQYNYLKNNSLVKKIELLNIKFYNNKK
jgi:membrane-associated phospholipid phosphatase